MKNIFYLTMMSILLLVFTSCSSDSDDDGLNPLSPGGGNSTANVTFTISIMQGQQGGIIFVATPSVNVKITKVTVSLPAQSFTDILSDDGTYVYNANEGVQIEEYTGVASGQQWNFQFEGYLASNNEGYNVTSNYTIP